MIKSKKYMRKDAKTICDTLKMRKVKRQKTRKTRLIPNHQGLRLIFFPSFANNSSASFLMYFTLYRCLNCFLEYVSFLVVFCFFCMFWVLFLWVKNQGKLLLLKHHNWLIAGLFFMPLGSLFMLFSQVQLSWRRTWKSSGKEL